MDDEYTDGPKEHIHSGPKSFLMTMEKYVSKKNIFCSKKIDKIRGEIFLIIPRPFEAPANIHC